MMKRLIFVIMLFYTVAMFLSACAGSKKLSTGESYLLRSWILDKESKEFVSPNYTKDRKFWIFDSMVIAEGQLVVIKQDEYGKEVWNVEVNKYTFVDLRTRSFYEYSNFSDTATIIDKFAQPDTGRVKGGWGFFSTQSAIELKNIMLLPDTIISKVVYKRVRSFKINQLSDDSGEEIQTAFIRCDKKKGVYQVDNPLSNKMGCPVIRIEKHYPQNQSAIAYEIEFLPDKLTTEELKVFLAWKENAKKYPVNISK